jgi:hypothetical protein
LRWVPPDDQTQSINAAVAAAKSAHKVVIFAYDEGTEGRDRGGSDGLQLPGYQDALIEAVAAANPNTMVVLNTGDAVLMPWADSVKAILDCGTRARWVVQRQPTCSWARLIQVANCRSRSRRTPRSSPRMTPTARTPPRPATARSTPAWSAMGSRTRSSTLEAAGPGVR